MFSFHTLCWDPWSTAENEVPAEHMHLFIFYPANRFPLLHSPPVPLRIGINGYQIGVETYARQRYCHSISHVSICHVCSMQIWPPPAIMTPAIPLLQFTTTASEIPLTILWVNALTNVFIGSMFSFYQDENPKIGQILHTDLRTPLCLNSLICCMCRYLSSRWQNRALLLTSQRVALFRPKCYL